ncbi:MAG: LOG family protein [Rhodobacterales bacterium]|nr:LOG family protein [Rhodobacterales bacterium]
MSDLAFCPQTGALVRGGKAFDPWALAWTDHPRRLRAPRPVTPLEALEALGPRLRQVPVGVIGPRHATPEQAALAEALGKRLGALGLVVMCGGKGGVMAAVCRGARAAGGLTIGLLPDGDWRAANGDVAVPIATGIGVARNAIIARAARALIAVGGGPGTLSEMAFGVQFGRPVLALSGAPHVDGAVPCPDLDTALDRLARHLLDLD